jgi:phosphohistidine phosphatase
MQIFIMRHGQASYESPADSTRPLTEQGKIEAQLMASWMSKMDIDPSHVWVSPFVRAQQTCEQVLEKLTNAKVDTNQFITPSGIASEVHDYIDGELALNSCNQLLIISHMPLVSYLVAELTQQTQAPIFQTASVCEIEYNLETMKGEMVRIVAPIDLC